MLYVTAKTDPAKREVKVDHQSSTDTAWEDVSRQWRRMERMDCSMYVLDGHGLMVYCYNGSSCEVDREGGICASCISLA